jgi:hypothetical protein
MAKAIVKFEGFGILSRKGVVLEAYSDDFKYALARLNVLNLGIPRTMRSRLVKVTAVLEKLSAKQIKQRISHG